MAESEVKLAVGLEDHVSGPSDAMAASLEGLRARLEADEAAVKNLFSAQRNLRGSSDEVREAKKKLAGQIQTLQSRISTANIAILQEGTSFAALNKRVKENADVQKKAAEAQKAQSGAIATALGPIGKVRASLSEFGELLKNAAGGGGAGLFKFALAGVAAAAVMAAAAVVAGGVALGKWIVSAANAQRAAQLQRQAWTDTAQSAENLGDHIDLLARRVPLTKAALNEMGISLLKSGLQGQTLVDTLKATASAASALGDDASKKLEEFVTRGARSKRFVVNPMETVGTGLKFDELAKSLADGMHTSVDAARKALVSGQVPLEQGAAALKDAIEKKFGSINAKKMLDIDVIASKMSENLHGLTRGVNLEPLLQGLQGITDLFSESTETGAGLKAVLQGFASVFGSLVTASLPLVKAGIKGLVLGALDLYIAFLQAKKAVSGWFGDSDVKKVRDYSLVITTMKYSVGLLAVAVGAVVVVLGAMAAAVLAPVAALAWLQKKSAEIGVSLRAPFKDLKDWFLEQGPRILDGLVQGIRDGAGRAWDAVKDVGAGIRDKFKEVLGIHSPSLEMRLQARQVPKGVELGIRDGTPNVEKAMRDMAAPDVADLSALASLPPPVLPAMAQGGAASRSVTMNVNVHVEGGSGSPSEIGTAVAEAFSTRVLRMLERSAVGAGVPVTP